MCTFASAAAAAAAGMLHSPVGAYAMATNIRPLSMQPPSPGAGTGFTGQQPSPRLQELQRQQYQLQQQILAQQQIEYAAAAGSWRDELRANMLAVLHLRRETKNNRADYQNMFSPFFQTAFEKPNLN